MAGFLIKFQCALPRQRIMSDQSKARPTFQFSHFFQFLPLYLRRASSSAAPWRFVPDGNGGSQRRSGSRQPIRHGHRCEPFASAADGIPHGEGPSVGVRGQVSRAGAPCAAIGSREKQMVASSWFLNQAIIDA